MPKASDLKRGDVVQIENAPHVVKQLEAKSPSARGRVNSLQDQVSKPCDGPETR